MLQSPGLNSAMVQRRGKPLEVGDQFACSFGSFAVRARQQKDLAILIGIVKKCDDCERSPRCPALGGGNIGGLFICPRVNILNDFLPCCFIEDKAEIQLVAEQGGPRVGPRATKKNKVVVALQV